MHSRLHQVPFLMFVALSLISVLYCACDPDDFGHAYDIAIVARQPADVDVVELCVSSPVMDSTVCDTTWGSQYSEADFSVDWDSLNVPSNKAEFTAHISFLCKGTKIPLPPYTIEASGPDQTFYYFGIFDERHFPYRRELVTFLSPEDTTCGKFVNFAVFK